MNLRNTLTAVHIVCALRYLRASRAALQVDLVRLQDKAITHGNGAAQDAIRVLDTEVNLLEDVVQELWKMAISSPEVT